jgi:hypothetical protein
MPEATNWSILIKPTIDGYSIKDSADDDASEIVCAEVALAVTETLSAFLDSE